MDSSAKAFLSTAIDDYNTAFKTNFGVDSNGFQNYYRDLFSNTISSGLGKRLCNSATTSK
jgi:type I site-specific restriction-modification system R (restriction) subunit